MDADRRATARIYQFPVKRQAAARSGAAQTPFALDQRATRTPTVEFGSGWYHGAAIESEQVPPRAG